MKRAYALADMVSNSRSPSANREQSGLSNGGLDRYLQVRFWPTDHLIFIEFHLSECKQSRLI